MLLRRKSRLLPPDGDDYTVEPGSAVREPLLQDQKSMGYCRAGDTSVDSGNWDVGGATTGEARGQGERQYGCQDVDTTEGVVLRDEQPSPALNTGDVGAAAAKSDGGTFLV